MLIQYPCKNFVLLMKSTCFVISKILVEVYNLLISSHSANNSFLLLKIKKKTISGTTFTLVSANIKLSRKN